MSQFYSYRWTQTKITLVEVQFVWYEAIAGSSVKLAGGLLCTLCWSEFKCLSEQQDIPDFVKRGCIILIKKYDNQNIRPINTANSTKLYRTQIHTNIFCEWKIPQLSQIGTLVPYHAPAHWALSISAPSIFSFRKTLSKFPVTHFPRQLPD